MATLVRVLLSIQVTGDGVDSNSTVDFQLQHPNYPDVADYHLGNTSVGNNDYFQRDLGIHDNRLQPNDIQSSILYLAINARGRDHFQGNPSVSFTFDNGQVIGANFKPFGIGTFQESNNTHQPVIGIL